MIEKLLQKSVSVLKLLFRIAIGRVVEGKNNYLPDFEQFMFESVKSTCMDHNTSHRKKSL